MDDSTSYQAESAYQAETPMQPVSGPPAKRSSRSLLIVAAAAFVLGCGLTFYFARGDAGPVGFGDLFQVRKEEPVSSATANGTPSPVPIAGSKQTEAAKDARQAVKRVEQVVEQQGGLDQRVAAMEQRLARLDLQTEAAAGNAARAEGLLIAFATRRAIERGAPLGYLADQLKLRFGDARPNAVQTVIEASQDPVTLDQLLARLDGLSAQLENAPKEESLVARFGREVTSLFVVRTRDTPSPRAELRIERARLFLESGRAAAAASEIRHLPNAQVAADWIGDAERYAATQRMLELLEMTAILEPRELRDGTGRRVEQLSPAGINGPAPAN